MGSVSSNPEEPSNSVSPALDERSEADGYAENCPTLSTANGLASSQEEVPGHRASTTAVGSQAAGSSSNSLESENDSEDDTFSSWVVVNSKEDASAESPSLAVEVSRENTAPPLPPPGTSQSGATSTQAVECEDERKDVDFFIQEITGGDDIPCVVKSVKATPDGETSLGPSSSVSETIPVGNVARHPGGGGGPGARTTPHAFVRCYCKEMVRTEEMQAHMEADKSHVHLTVVHNRQEFLFEKVLGQQQDILRELSRRGPGGGGGTNSSSFRQSRNIEVQPIYNPVINDSIIFPPARNDSDNTNYDGDQDHNKKMKEMTTQDDDDDDNSRSTVDSGLLPCPNKGQGCLVELLLEDLVKHMAECPYREELDEPVQVPSQATPPAPATESEGVTDDVGPGQNALAPPSDAGSSLAADCRPEGHETKKSDLKSEKALLQDSQDVSSGPAPMPHSDNIYHERDRPCPNADQGCTERVSDAELRHHIKYECRARLREVAVPTRDYAAQDVSDMGSASSPNAGGKFVTKEEFESYKVDQPQRIEKAKAEERTRIHANIGEHVLRNRYCHDNSSYFDMDSFTPQVSAGHAYDVDDSAAVDAEVPTGTSSSIEAAVSYNGGAVDAEVESEEEPAAETVTDHNASLTNADSAATSAEDSPTEDNQKNVPEQVEGDSCDTVSPVLSEDSYEESTQLDTPQWVNVASHDTTGTAAAESRDTDHPVAHERPGLLPNVTDASDAVVVVLVDRSIQDGSPSFTGQNTFAESHPSAVTEVPLGTSSSIEVAVSYNDNAVDAEVESEEVPAVETVAGDNASLTNAGSRARSAEDSAVPSVEDSPPQDNEMHPVTEPGPRDTTSRGKCKANDGEELDDASDTQPSDFEFSLDSSDGRKTAGSGCRRKQSRRKHRRKRMPLEGKTVCEDDMDTKEVQHKRAVKSATGCLSCQSASNHPKTRPPDYWMADDDDISRCKDMQQKWPRKTAGTSTSLDPDCMGQAHRPKSLKSCIEETESATSNEGMRRGHVCAIASSCIPVVEEEHSLAVARQDCRLRRPPERGGGRSHHRTHGPSCIPVEQFDGEHGLAVDYQDGRLHQPPEPDCFVLLSSPLDIVYRAEAYKQQGKHHIDGLAQAILVPPLMAYLRRKLRCTPREFEYVVHGSGGPHAAAQRFMQLFGKMESSDVCFVVECALHVDRIAFFVELASEENSKVVRQCVQWTFQQCCCTDNCPFGIGDLHGLLQKDRCLL